MQETLNPENAGHVFGVVVLAVLYFFMFLKTFLGDD